MARCVWAAIFDLDGTLVDSEPLSLRAYEELLGRHGYALGPGEVLNGHVRWQPLTQERVDFVPGVEPRAAASRPARAARSYSVSGSRRS